MKQNEIEKNIFGSGCLVDKCPATQEEEEEEEEEEGMGVGNAMLLHLCWLYADIDSCYTDDGNWVTYDDLSGAAPANTKRLQPPLSDIFFLSLSLSLFKSYTHKKKVEEEEGEEEEEEEEEEEVASILR